MAPEITACGISFPLEPQSVWLVLQHRSMTMIFISHQDKVFGEAESAAAAVVFKWQCLWQFWTAWVFLETNCEREVTY